VDQLHQEAYRVCVIFSLQMKAGVAVAIGLSLVVVVVLIIIIILVALGIGPFNPEPSDPPPNTIQYEAPSTTTPTT
jgi:hypothetical protein